MSFVLAVLVFPLLLAVLSFGIGLLVERISALTLPGVLLMPLGFAAIVGVTQLTTWSGATAPATPYVLIVLALAGVVSTRRETTARWRARRSGWWWGWIPAPAAYLVAIAPVLLSGRVTFPAYLLDTTGAIQLMGTQRLITHGQSFNVEGTGYGNQLHGYFGTGYPSGSHTALGGVGRLVGVDFLWLSTPYQAAMLGLAALVLAWIGRRAGLPRPAAAVAGLLAAVPALVYAYVLQGSIKEIALLPVLMLLGALILLARELMEAGPRGAIPLGVIGAAGWACIGLAFTPWLAVAAVAILIAGFDRLRALGDRRVQVRALAERTGVFVAALVLLALPTVARLHTSLDQAGNVTNSNATAAGDPGNLLRPLLKVQLFGVWLGSTHRTDPEHLTLTYVLIGVMAVAVMLGVAWLISRRQWGVLLFGAVMVLVWLVLTPRATTWTAAKLIVLLSPVVVLAACIGAFGRLGSRRVEGILLGAALALGILLSDGYLYHSTTLAPTARFDELRTIGQRDVDKKPTLIPDFDEYALYLLRDGAPDGPGEARHQVPFSTTTGEGVGYGHTYDLDTLPVDQVDDFGTIVVRRSAFKSRPPSTFELLRRGRYYDVWRKRSGATAPRTHLGIGSATQPAMQPACRTVQRLAARARGAGASTLSVAQRPPNAVVDLASAQHSSLAVPQPAGGFGWVGPGTVIAQVTVPSAGRYRLWMEGVVGRPLAATIDGRSAGVTTDQYGGEGNAMALDAIDLTAGMHTLTLTRGGGSLRPGDASGTQISAAALEPVSAEQEPVRSIPVGDWRTLCHQTVDWIEVP